MGETPGGGDDNFAFVKGEPIPAEGGGGGAAPRRPDVTELSIIEIPPGNLNYSYCVELSPDGNTVFVGGEKYNSENDPSIIQAFDASNPSNLIEIGRITYGSGNVYYLEAAGDILYANTIYTTAVIDVSDPGAMSLINTFKETRSGNVQNIGDWLYFSEYSIPYIQYVNVSDPASITAGDLRSSGRVFGMGTISGMAADPDGRPYLYITYDNRPLCTVAFVGGARPIPAGFSSITPAIASDAARQVASRPDAGAYAALGRDDQLTYVSTM